ncbi:MAG TPA: type IV pilin N-terminal domain-containing protein [Thermoplasmata archaeon]|nr:type IV pilin N-terminal domain-containing protein [Thermoplasmata archaeon]
MKAIIRKDEQAVSPVIATILMVAITVVLAAVLYVMVSGLLVGPGTGPQTIGVSRQDTSNNWVLSIANVPAPHSVATTTFIMRWASNSSVVNPPGQATLDALKTASGGVQYSPVSGATQTDLRPADVITIAKSGFSYVAGMQISILDGTTLLWSGTL